MIWRRNGSWVGPKLIPKSESTSETSSRRLARNNSRLGQNNLKAPLLLLFYLTNSLEIFLEAHPSHTAPIPWLWRLPQQPSPRDSTETLPISSSLSSTFHSYMMRTWSVKSQQLLSMKACFLAENLARGTKSMPKNPEASSRATATVSYDLEDFPRGMRHWEGNRQNREKKKIH